MKVYENDCVDCGLPCLYSGCPYYSSPHWYCDRCEEEMPPEDLRELDGEQLCQDCIMKVLPKVRRD